MKTYKWIIQETDADLKLMAKVLKISETTANVMANRGLRSKNAALSFLSPSLHTLHDTLRMKDAEAALIRISAAINSKEKIVVYGDYDADGIMSVAIMQKVLTRLGADISHYIPHRQDEGYGMNICAVQKLAADGTRLIIAVDNGIVAVEEIALAAELGIDTVIIDHHEPGDVLPNAVAIVDPKQHDCDYPFKEMCAAGLTYKIAAALCDFLGVSFDERDEMLVFASVATICDIVPLVGENRVIVNCGLAVLSANKLINPGLGSLITVRGYLGKPVDAFTVGYVVGPCLNATGRLESAELSIELLMAHDFARRMTLAHKLSDLNEQRKSLTSDCVHRVLEELDMDNLDKVLVIVDTEAHESVAGIVAGRVREITNRPTVLLTHGDGEMKGSGRSVPAFNLYEALSAHRELFTRFGGHAMAAGLTMPAENIPILREALNRDCRMTEEDFHSVMMIDRELGMAEVTLELSDELTRLAPFGKDNSEPLFITRGLLAENVRVLDEKHTLIFTFYSPYGGRVKGIAYGLNKVYAEHLAANGMTEQKRGGFSMDVVYNIEANVYNGVTSVQMRVRDFLILAE